MTGGSALSWLDRAAILLTVAGIVLAALYQGWREDRARTRDLRDLRRNEQRFGPRSLR